MSWWPFRCKEQSSPEDDPDEVITITATPYAGRVSEMLAAGWPGDQIVAVLQMLEVERVTTEARVEARFRAVLSAPTSAKRPARNRDSRVDASADALRRRRERDAARKPEWRKNKSKLRLIVNGTGGRSSEDVSR